MCEKPDHMWRRLVWSFGLFSIFSLQITGVWGHAWSACPPATHNQFPHLLLFSLKLRRVITKSLSNQSTELRILGRQHVQMHRRHLTLTSSVSVKLLFRTFVELLDGNPADSKKIRKHFFTIEGRCKSCCIQMK